MAIDFSGIAIQAYQGTPYAIPMQIGKVGLYAVPLKFNWANYGGLTTTNLLIGVNLGPGGSQVRQTLDKIRSLYIDNVGSQVPIYVIFPDTNFVVVCQPYSAGWYPVFTNSYVFNVAALGLTARNITTTNIIISNSNAVPYTDTALQSVLGNELSSLVIGGGAGLSSITPIFGGQSYANGNLSITGGGGNGAQAHGILDSWGRFLQVIIDNPGNGYTGLPIITPTAANNAAAAFNQASTYNPGNKLSYQGTEWQWSSPGNFSIPCGAANYASGTTYPVGAFVNYVSIIYQCLKTNGPNVGAGPPNNIYWRAIGSAQPSNYSQGVGVWTNSGTPGGTAAKFISTLSPATPAIPSPGYALPALGDQAISVTDTITAAAKFRSNLWGTPYGSGFVYLTHLEAYTQNLLAEWQIASAAYVAFAFNPIVPGRIISLQKMNMKLDATVEWFLTCNSYTANNKVTHNFAWTIAAI